MSEDYNKFKVLTVQDGTLVWPSVSVESTDEEGNTVVYPFDVNPAMLCEAGKVTG